MHSIRRYTLILVTLALASVRPSSLGAQTVVLHQQPDEPLRQRWEWALEQPQQRGWKAGAWIGYSIQRWMRENSYIGSYREPQRPDDLPLLEVIFARRSREKEPHISEEEAVRRAAQRALAELRQQDSRGQKVRKEVALLFRFRPGPAIEDGPMEIKVSNLSLPVDLEGCPLLWLGKASDEESIALLKAVYDRLAGTEVKEDAIAAVGVHESASLAVPFLQQVLTSREEDEVREKAAFWLGQQDTESALQVLLKAAQSDRSEEVREKAVFAISQISLEAGTDALIDLARRASSPEVRRKAIFWLGQKASKRAAVSLEEAASTGTDTEVQKKAVFALSQMPRHRGIPGLIRIAWTHPNLEVRKKAIFWLGQSDDPRALEALVEIVRGKK
jgi:HEAT repeat protein